ncbi:MAG: ATP-binding protein, partial [Propionibacteriaceae bacterium]|nr:ATP-binding protein [Propionibacteriaceae bacterium]
MLAVLADLRVRGGDSTLVEAKRAGGGVPNLAETLCAFGNMPAGGTILLGVDERQGFAVTGVADVAALEAGVAGQARTAVTPPVHVDFESVDVAGQTVLVVTVEGLPLAAKP